MLMYISKLNTGNNYKISNNVKKMSFTGSASVHGQDSINKTSETRVPVDNKTIATKVVGGLTALGSLTWLGIAVKKGKLNFLKDIHQYKPKMVKTKWNPIRMGGKTTAEAEYKIFTEKYVSPIKEGKKPQNAFYVEGPESKGKEEFFNWSIEQLSDAGVEIIDCNKELEHSTGKNADALMETLHSKAAEQFKTDGKYRLFVLRKSKGIDPKFNHNPNNAGLPSGADGVIYAYNCSETSHINPAARKESINRSFSPMPKTDEDLSIWKDYTKHVKKQCSPVWVNKKLNETEEIMAKRNFSDSQEIELYLRYHPPYKMPKTGHVKNGWEKYFNVSKRDLTETQQYDEFANAASFLNKDYSKKQISEEKYNNIIGMLKEYTPKKYKDSIDKWINMDLNLKNAGE